MGSCCTRFRLNIAAGCRGVAAVPAEDVCQKLKENCCELSYLDPVAGVRH